MTRYRGRPIGLHEDVACRRAFDAFVEYRGVDGAIERAGAIAALPLKSWRGRRGTLPATTLYRIRCHGTRGNGEHDVFVPERILWTLIDFAAFRCAYHLGDE